MIFRNILNRIVKSKDEIEEAFAKWKNEKDKELENRNKEKKKENEKKLELQRQQKERKNLAEKVFNFYQNYSQKSLEYVLLQFLSFYRFFCNGKANLKKKEKNK